MRFSWYFGWNIVIAASILTLLSSGLRMSMGVFFLPIANDLGFSRSVLSGIIAIGMLFSGIAMPIAGYLVGKYGTRFVLLLGTLKSFFQLFGRRCLVIIGIFFFHLALHYHLVHRLLVQLVSHLL